VKELVEVALFSDNAEAVKSFYGRLLGTAPEVEWPGGAIYAVGRAKLLMHERGSAPEGEPPNEDHFALGVADLDAVAAKLEAAGFTFLVPPRDFPWGRSAYLRDPDGRLVELSQST
jgi:predicted enzyme related to lactoylglutathione lyase